MKTFFFRILLLALLAGWPLAGSRAADTFVWDAKQGHVTADVNGWPLPELLKPGRSTAIKVARSRRRGSAR